MYTDVILSDARIVANRMLESTMVFHDDTDDDTEDNTNDDTDDDTDDDRESIQSAGQ